MEVKLHALLTRWRCMVSLTLLLLYSRRKNSQFSLDKRMSGTQSESERGGEGEVVLVL
jgi:hypothetical protein